jgi:hypothetical protein
MKQRAVKALTDLLGEMGRVKVVDRQVKMKADLPGRTFSLVEFKYGKERWLILVCVRTSGEPRLIAEFAGVMKAMDITWYPVFIAPFISERGRDLCKVLGIGCLDMAGNAFLRVRSVWIDRWGASNIKNERRLQRKLFTEKSTFIMRRMLIDPTRTWTYQGLARESRVSAGEAFKVVRRLADEGFVTRERGKIALANPGSLLDAWRETYRFGDNQMTGYFSLTKDRDARMALLKGLDPESYAITLGAASIVVTAAVRTTDLYIYVRDDPVPIIKALDLEPVESGANTVIVTPPNEGVLFDTQRIDGKTIVSNLQLYLDLYNHAGRGREQAEAIRERLLRV